MQAHTFTAPSQLSAFSEKLWILSSAFCIAACRTDGKDSGVKVGSGVNKGGSILAGNSWVCKGVGVMIHEMLPSSSSFPPCKEPVVGAGKQGLSGQAFGRNVSGSGSKAGAACQPEHLLRAALMEHHQEQNNIS